MNPRKILALSLAGGILMTFMACTGSRQPAGMGYNQNFNQYVDTPLTQSLFMDQNATISEEHIDRILRSKYKLPEKIRLAIVRLDAGESSVRSFYGGWNDEQYIKSRQAYLDKFVTTLSQSSRISNVKVMPDILIPKSPGFTMIREAAIRMQADVVLVYGIRSDLYSKYKVFNKPELKAFATTQLIIMDVRTGMIPFSSTVTKDYQTQQQKGEMDYREATSRVLQEAVLLTLNELGAQLNLFLEKGSY